MNEHKLPDWSGQTVVCVGTGPSLTEQQLSLVHGLCKVIAINDAGLPFRVPFCADWADLWYAADLDFWVRYREQLAFSAALRVCAQAEAARLVDVTINVYDGRIVSGGHSGFQALQLAAQLGAARVLLLGYDCRHGPRAETNYFGRKPPEMERGSPYEQWAPLYRTLKLPCPVFNCTPGSAIDAFQRRELRDVLGVAREVALC